MACQIFPIFPELFVGGASTDAKRVEELKVSPSTEGAACESGPTKVPKTLRS